MEKTEDLVVMSSSWVADTQQPCVCALDSQDSLGRANLTLARSYLLPRFDLFPFGNAQTVGCATFPFSYSPAALQAMQEVVLPMFAILLRARASAAPTKPSHRRLAAKEDKLNLNLI